MKLHVQPHTWSFGTTSFILNGSNEIYSDVPPKPNLFQSLQVYNVILRDQFKIISYSDVLKNKVDFAPKWQSFLSKIGKRLFFIPFLKAFKLKENIKNSLEL